MLVLGLVQVLAGVVVLVTSSLEPSVPWLLEGADRGLSAGWPSPTL